MTATDFEGSYRRQWEEMRMITRVLLAVADALEIGDEDEALQWLRRRANEPDIARQIEQFREKTASAKLAGLRSARLPFKGLKVDGSPRWETGPPDKNDQNAETNRVLAARGAQARRHAAMADDRKAMEAFNEREAAKRREKEAMYERIAREAQEAQ